MQAFMSQSVRPGSRVDATYSVPVDSLGDEELKEEIKRLTLQARSSFGPPLPPVEVWDIRGDRLHVPRFYGLIRFGPPEEDARVLGDPITLRFEGTLTAVQQRATDTIFARYLSETGACGAMVCLPCGYGKTVWAVHTIARLGRKACIFVHKSFLRDQWERAFLDFCPGVRVGVIQGKTWRIDDCDVVIAMVMTMAKRDYESEVMDSFGTICFDECHHMAARVMNRATRCCRAKYVLGLTATKDRPDGLTPLLHWSLGPEGFRVERDTETVQVSVALFSHGAPQIQNREGKPIVSIMVNKLAENERRNEFIARRVVAFYRAGRVILVLSDRIAQLKALHRLLLVAPGMPEGDVGIFTGATKETDRAVQLERRIVMCSFGMANEGLDKREADTCVMATPKGRVTQCIGRIQRPCETKKTPLVLDVCDDAPVFVQLRWRRQKLYSKERYEVQVRPAEDGPEVEEWFC